MWHFDTSLLHLTKSDDIIYKKEDLFVKYAPFGFLISTNRDFVIYLGVLQQWTQFKDYDWIQEICLTSRCLQHGFYHEATLFCAVWAVSENNNNIWNLFWLFTCASTLCWIARDATGSAYQTCRRSTTNYLAELCDCLTMSSTHIPPQSSASQRYYLIAHTDYSCHHAHTVTPHDCQTSSHECCTKTNIRHITFELLYVFYLLCIAGLRSDMSLINKDWLIDLSDLFTFSTMGNVSVHRA